MIKLHRELGGAKLLLVRPELLTLVEPQPTTSPNPHGALITYNEHRIAVTETFEEVEAMLLAANSGGAGC